MFHDIITVIEKELKEVTRQRGSRATGWLTILTSIGLLGIYMPYMTGRDWVLSPVGPLSFSWLPLFLAMGIIADGFAGERERHTIETLLASRLPDRAILYGKLITAVCYSTSIALVGLLMGGFVANLSTLQDGFIYYSPGLLAFLVFFEILASTLVSAFGVLVSLRASSVRQAYQQMNFGLLGLAIAVFVFFRLLPQSWKTGLGAAINASSAEVLAAGVLAFVAVFAAIILLIAQTRFQRARLILD